MTSFITLIRRELWEHNNLWRLPAVLIVLTLLANMAFSGSIKWISDLITLTAMPLNSQVVDGTLRSISSIFFVIFSLMAMLYIVDCLHAERKDKSILFWRSLPVSDTATVLSKLAVGVIVIPAIAWLCIVLVHIVTLLIQSLLNSNSTLFQSVATQELVSYWLNLLIVFGLTSLWTLPLFTWLLFCSAWTRRTPFLAAITIPIIVQLIDQVFTLDLGLTKLFAERMPIGESILNVFGHSELVTSASTAAGIGQVKLGIDNYADYLTQPSMWIGWCVAAAFVGAAIWMRRWRDDG